MDLNMKDIAATAAEIDRLTALTKELAEALEKARKVIEKDLEEATVHDWTKSERAPYDAAIAIVRAALRKYKEQQS